MTAKDLMPCRACREGAPDYMCTCDDEVCAKHGRSMSQCSCGDPDDSEATPPAEPAKADLTAVIQAGLMHMIAQFDGPVISFDVKEPFYLASCDICGWVGSTEQCPHSEEDAICPRCYTSGADCGKVAEALANYRITREEELSRKLGEAERALEPFATFADTFVDDEGWTGPMRQERIVDWFGPSDFRDARKALTLIMEGR